MLDLEPLEATLGVAFGDKALLHLALAHSSYLNENPGVFTESNERLEFLGDSVVGAVVAAELFRRHPDWPEGDLTHGRSVLVRGETLARLAEALGLGGFLYMGKGEEEAGGKRRSNNLAAVLEAVVGAAFLDGGYGVARDLVLRMLVDELAALDRPTVPRDPKSALQEALQARGLPAPQYRIVNVEGEEHSRMFTAQFMVDGEVAASGAGKRKSLAEQAAAAEALRHIEKDGE